MSPKSESVTYNTYTKSVFAVLDENVPNSSVAIKKPDRRQYIINIKVQSPSKLKKLQKIVLPLNVSLSNVIR